MTACEAYVHSPSSPLTGSYSNIFQTQRKLGIYCPTSLKFLHKLYPSLSHPLPCLYQEAQQQNLWHCWGILTLEQARKSRQSVQTFNCGMAGEPVTRNKAKTGLLPLLRRIFESRVEGQVTRQTDSHKSQNPQHFFLRPLTTHSNEVFS